MEFSRPLCVLLVLLTIVSSSQAYKFYVGGSAGWVPNPSESYNQWAGRNRFQINDTLVFKYKKGSDSVLEVKKEDYDKCNKSNPMKKFEDGDTEFKLDRSGPFYFISGNDQNCEKGQKLTIVVLAPRGQTQTPPPPSPKPPSPSPSPKPSPSPSPSVSPSHPPSESPTSPPPTPSGHPPSPSVSPSPAVSPVPASGPPAPSPATSPAPAGKSPSPSPAAGSPGPVSGPPAPSPATGAPGPVSGPPAPSPGTPAAPLGSSPSPSGGSPPPSSPGAAQTPSSSSETTPPPGSYAWAVAPSSFLVYSVTIVVGAVLLR